MIHKSFYDARFAVAPGGTRKDSHHICGSLDEVTAAMESEFKDCDAARLLLTGADLTVDVYQQGKRTQSIDLHPFITIRVSDYPVVTFRGPGQPISEGADVPRALTARICNGDFAGSVEVSVRWDAVRIPSLLGYIAGWEDYVLLGDGPLGNLDGLDELDEDDLADELIDRGYIEYGHHDFES